MRGGPMLRGRLMTRGRPMLRTYSASGAMRS
jgi:hypothetical protein